MRAQRRLVAGILTGLLGLGVVACEVENGEGDPLEDDPGLEEPADS